MLSAYRAGLAAAALCVALGAPSAQAQYYEEGYDGPPPPRRSPRYEEPYGRPPPRPVGLNCDAIQPGLFAPQPFSCPLPGPRPLGARCFCNTPVAPLSGGNTVAGRVVP